MLDTRYSQVKYDIVTNGRKLLELCKNNMEKTCCEIRYTVIMMEMDLPEVESVGECSE